MSKKINGKTASEWRDLGFELGKEGKFQEAINFLDNAIKLEPKLEDAYYYLGAAYEKLEKLLNVSKKKLRTSLIIQNH
jgi:tetratricopeptide (TPR) repeat protein